MDRKEEPYAPLLVEPVHGAVTHVRREAGHGSKVPRLGSSGAQTFFIGADNSEGKEGASPRDALDEWYLSADDSGEDHCPTLKLIDGRTVTKGGMAEGELSQSVAVTSIHDSDITSGSVRSWYEVPDRDVIIKNTFLDMAELIQVIKRVLID